MSQENDDMNSDTVSGGNDHERDDLSLTGDLPSGSKDSQLSLIDFSPSRDKVFASPEVKSANAKTIASKPAIEQTKPLALFAGLMKYLPARDLLNCRFMNHSWNQQIVPVLTKRNVYIKLTNQNYQSYEFLLEATPSAPTLGLGCSLILNNPIKLNMNIAYTTSISAIWPLDLYALTAKLRCLKSGFLKHLHIDLNEFHRVRAELTPVLEQIHHSGADLRFLRMDIRDKKPRKDRTKYLKTSRMLQNISLPALETMHFQTNNNSLSELLISLLNKAPKLEDLTINIADAETSVHNSTIIKCNYLTKLTLHSATYGIKFINNMHLPALQTLKINFQLETQLDKEVAARLSQFLETNCPLLRTLDLYYYRNSTDPTDLVDLLTTVVPQFEVPTLPNLTHFGCHVKHDEKKIFFAIHNLAQLEKKFPKLTSVSVTPGTYFCDDSLESPAVISFSTDHSAAEYLELKGVSTIRLQDWFPDDPNFDPTAKYKNEWDLGTISQLSLLLPNVRKVTIAPLLQKVEFAIGIIGLEEVHRIWTKTIETTLKTFPSLEELVIENCFEDYFSEIWIKLHLGLVENSICRFPGITRLRLPSISWLGIPRSDWFQQKYPILDLLNLFQLFPNLKTLEIDSRFIGFTKEEVEMKLSYFQASNVCISLISGN